VAQTHDDFAELTGLYVLGGLDEAERRAFEAHASGCVQCSNEIRALTPVSSALGHLATAASPSPDVKRRLLESISRQKAAAGQGSIAASAAGDGDDPSRPYRASAEPRGSRMVPWLAAAAAIALAAALGAYALQLRRDAGADRITAAVLAAPDLVRIDLAGQAAAPSASARAFWSRGQGLVFTASNLPAAPSGRVYQLWVLSRSDAESAGLMKPDANGLSRPP
jgi:hypothetical protein